MNKAVSKQMIVGSVAFGKKVLSVTERVLLELVEQYEDLVYMRTHCYAVLGQNVREARYENEEAKRLYDSKMKRQAIKRLKEQKFIKLRKEGDRIIYELTANGKVRAIKIAIKHCCDCYPDGSICLVSFDFPVAANGARKALRRFLKSIGFVFVQGSVWSTKKDIAKEMRALVRLIKISRWVEIYIAKQ